MGRKSEKSTEPDPRTPDIEREREHADPDIEREFIGGDEEGVE
jgi:hypothetical protein